MEWSESMDVIALIMHQINNSSQHLWLQRCVGKWQTLLNVDLSQELDEGTTVQSLTWRFDGNGVCLGLSNGEYMTCYIENDKKENNEIHDHPIMNIKWNIDITDTQNDDEKEHNQFQNKKYSHFHNQHYDKENVDTSNFDHFEDLFGSQTNLDDINNVIQNDENLLSCTQLHDYNESKQNEMGHVDIDHQFGQDSDLLNSLKFKDETNKFLSKIPCMPKQPRIDFRYKINPNANTLQSNEETIHATDS